MRKSILYFFILCAFLLIQIKTSSYTSAETIEGNNGNFFVVDVIDAQHYHNTPNEGRLFKTMHNQIYIYQLYDRVNYLEAGYEVIIHKKDAPSKTVRSQFRIEGYSFQQDHFLVWGKKRVNLIYDYVIYKYDYQLILIDQLHLNNVGYASFPNMIYLNQNYYFCGGASGNNPNFSAYNDNKVLDQSDAIVMILDTNLDIFDVWIYGGTSHERFTTIDYYDNKLLLVGEKSSISPGDFENIGQTNQEKVMLVALNMAGNIDRVIYFDHGSTYEFSTQKVIIDTFAFLHIYVEEYEEHYIYKIDLETSSIVWGRESQELTNEYIAITHMTRGSDDTLILIGTDANGRLIITGIHTLDGEMLGKTTNQTNFMCSSATIVNGMLNVTGDQVQIVNNRTEFYAKYIQMDQYTIEKNEEKICSKQMCQLEDTSHVQLSSWFGFPMLENRNIQANFSQNIHGRYNVTYRYRLLSNRLIEVNSTILVPFYANVIEGAMYGLGFKPIYTGIATLNSEPFISGKSINYPGNYQLVITNYQEETTTINFTIEAGILYSGDQNTIWNIECEKAEMLEIKISIYNPDHLNITAVYINQIAYPYFQVSEDYQYVIVDIVASNNAGIHHIVIDKLEYDYHGQTRSMNIDAIATINVLKTVPSVHLIEENSTNKTIHLKALFQDLDNAIINIKAILYENNVPVRSKEISLVNSSFNFEQLRTNTPYKAKILITYNVGNNIRQTKEMVEISFTTLKEHITLGNLTITKKGMYLEEAIIVFSKNDNQLLLSSIKVGEIELLHTSSNVQDYTIYYLISGGSVVVMVSTWLVIVVRKKHNSK